MTSAKLPSASIPRPRQAELDFRRGVDAAKQEKWQQAIDAFRRVVVRCPGDMHSHLQLARAYAKVEDWERGAEAAARALALLPGNSLIEALLALCLARSSRHQELIELCERIDMGAISDLSIHIEWGIALIRARRMQESVPVFLNVLNQDPRNIHAYAWLGTAFLLLEMPEESRECSRNVLAIAGPNVRAISSVIFSSLQAANWTTLEEDISALHAQIMAGLGQPIPFYALTLPWNRAQLLAASRIQARICFGAISPLPSPATEPNRGRRIRIGYVSGDFQKHATAHLVAEMFERHDQNRFEIYAYSYGINDASPMRRRLEAAFGERFFDAQAIPDKTLAHRIRDDGIDVLIDLKGYTLHSRNEVFGYRPAPIQVNFLGFPGSLGTPLYDYIIGDPIVTPLEHADGYDEKIAQMPDCYQPNDRQRIVGERRDRAFYGLPDDAVVFCSFNNNYKLTPEVFDRWCAILHGAPHAVLWLYEGNRQARRNLLAYAARRGVSSDRLHWAPPLPLADHLARAQVADLFLDTAPVNAHTTASDALWAGTPVLTVLGDTFVSRVAASLVHAAGLPELVAADLDEYERIALALAHDRDRLRALRTRLAERRMTCPLFDSARTTRAFESLVVRMVDRHRCGLGPDHLPAASAQRPEAT